MKKRTNEEFINLVYVLVKDEYTPLTKYINSQTKIDMHHSLCGHTYSVAPNMFLQGQRCPKCAGKMKKTTELYKREIFNLVGDEYAVTGEYNSAKKKIKMLHKLCNYEWEITPDNFLRGNRCPNCNGGTKYSHEVFKDKVYGIAGNEYDILSMYVNNKSKVKMKHIICGHNYEVTPRDFLGGNRCPKCFGNKKKTTEEFKDDVYNLVFNEYLVYGEYVNAHTLINMKHNICGTEFNTKPNNFLSGKRCPQCNESKGESKIRIFLSNNLLLFKNQYKIKKCKNFYPLPFDFAVFDKNKKLTLLIEYDGEHHFRPIDFYGGEKYFKYVQKNDQIKNMYCKENNIPLIRIPYWDFDNIEKILNKELINLKIAI